MSIRLLLLTLIVAVAAAGCGRRGLLEAPPARDASDVAGQPVPAQEAVQEEVPTPGSDLVSDPAVPGSAADRENRSAGDQEPAEAVQGTAPKRPFLLDPLL